MKIILLEDVKSLGKKDEIVEVSDGYARNMIIPKKKGLEATSKNLNNLKLKKKNEDKLAAMRLEEAKNLADEIAKQSVKLNIKIGSDGRSFGSISTKEITNAVKEQLNYDLDKKKMHLDTPIKSVGTFDVSIKLHPQVIATLKIIVEGK